MTPEPEHDREERLAALLRSVAADAPPSDRAALAALRERSLGEFVASAESESSALVQPPVQPSIPAAVPRKRSPMFTLAIRGLAVAAASAAAIVAWLNLGSPSAVRGAPFSDVVAELRSATTLELRITKEGHAAEISIRAPGLVRYEESPQRYRIAAGSRLWRIDEATNTMTTGDSPWFVNPNEQIDLLALLEVGVTDASPLLKSRPSGKSQYEGRACDVYAVELAGKTGPLQIEAFTDPTTNRLLGITARPAGAAANAGPPLAELQLVAMNAPIDETKFIVAKSLTEDGRIGKISDAQGVVVLRPMLAQRWTPICREMLLKPGDWLRTDIRGANAAKIRFSSDVELTLGPGTLIECISPTQARIHTGETQVNIPKAKQTKDKEQKPIEFELLAPRAGSQKFSTPGKVFLRLDRNEKLAEVKQLPKWLAGFEGTSADESLGSLIVNLPDGRNEPLSIGYHKVSVEIRDQIARTTIEESFVNHTNNRLEGVFHFPLPQDASISGFGMWIGDDLVEADIVEKQRAREIYETILREKRDPGLLEWTSGNLFKARVFPIEANSEKRVKIVYTQVLPLRANKYRYTYGLRSDLLRMKPVRELSLKVLVNSAIPLKSVSCPTHTARTQQTAHSATVEFAAQEYSPDRDFEVDCEIDGRQSDVVVVPHRRGSDGYLLVQLTPPSPDGNWQREVLPDGAPLNIVLLCDTSASMDSEKRKQQAEFVATVLSSLGEKDHFMLAACDVATAWAAPEPLAPTAGNIAKARDFLDTRVSLGWTNLDQAFDTVLRKSPAGAQIVYVGDGIPTAGDRDPASFVKRLARMVAQAKADRKVAWTLHSVTVGNVSEATVMKGIAMVGGGSVRSIGGEQTPQTVALEWLNEIAQPGLRDLAVEFRGVKVAAVYPQRLPNVPAGTQQILVGRYLPDGKDQQGEIIVTGKRGQEPVRYAAKINFADAEQGNSFIPRLWARSQLDFLLDQGSGPAVRDDIIALSEEFHIITPYTSLLVLETDADRERFGVKRRYEMRDGERFFAQGKANANFELAQQQMKRAANWRLGMRRRVLAQLATLGRDPRIFQQRSGPPLDLNPWGAMETRVAGGGSRMLGMLGRSKDSFDSDNLGGGMPVGSGYGPADFDSLIDTITSTVTPNRWESNGGAGSSSSSSTNMTLVVSQTQSMAGDLGDLPEYPVGLGAPNFDQTRVPDGSSFMEIDSRGEPLISDVSDLYGLSRGETEFAEPDPLAVQMSFNPETLQNEGEIALEETVAFHDKRIPDSIWVDGNYSANGEANGFMTYSESGKESALWANGPYDGESSGGYFTYGGGYYPNYTNWLNSLFPSLAGRPAKPRATIKAQKTWSPEAIALSKSLSRLDSLHKLAGGIEINTDSHAFDPIWNRTSWHTRNLTLYAPTAWLTKPINPDGQTIVNYCDKKERGVFSLALLLGQTRPSVERDLSTPPFNMSDWSLALLHETYWGFVARVERAGADQALLILSSKNSTNKQQYLIDMARHVVLQEEGFLSGKSTGITKFSDFVEVGGSWWARKSITIDPKGQKTAETTFDVKALAQDKFDEQMKAQLAARPTVQFLRHPFVKLKIARQHVADGSANFDDRIAMLLYYCQLQQWDDVFNQLSEAEKLTAGRPGVRWLRTVIDATIRRHEEARQRLLDEAKQLAAVPARNDTKPQQDEIFLADFVFGESQAVSSPAELLDALNLLKPVYDRQAAASAAHATWRERLANSYESLGRIEESLALRKALAADAPWDAYKQVDLARRLMQAGQADAAYAWLDKQLARPEERASSDDDTLRTAYADLYRQQTRWGDLLKFTTAWIARNPEQGSAYAEHLSALVFNDRLDAANALAEQWLKEARIEGKLEPAQSARLQAAIAFAEGNAYNLQLYRTQGRWDEPLAETARFLARHNDQLNAARQIMGNQFAQSEACDRLRAYFLGLSQTDLEKLTPEQINFLLGQSLSGRLEFAEPVNGRKQMNAAEVPDATWKKIAAQLHARWERTKDTSDTDGKYDKHLLGEALRTIYANRFSDTQLLPFLRERIKEATPELKRSYVTALLDALLAHKWSDEIEREAFSLLPQLSDGLEGPSRLFAQIAALHRLDDAMLAGRQAHANEELHDKGNTDKLTRTELAKKSAESRKAALTGLAKRLAEEAAQAEKAKNPLSNWFRIEQAWLEVQLDQNLDKVLAFCWTKLGELPPKQVADAEQDRDEDISREKLQQEALAGLMRQRALAIAMNLAARKSADPKAIQRLIRYIDAGIAQGGDMASHWRRIKFQLLIALDRPDDLEGELHKWIRADATTAPWRKSFALLLAERGKLDEAIGLFEACEKDHLLTAGDFRTLADWYQAQNRREAYERARLESFKQLPERYLAQIVQLARNRWWNGNNDRPLPTELDENTLLAFQSLFEKSANPGNYLYQLRDVYAACRDFRLLQMTPDALLGRSPEQIYPFLQNVHSYLLNEMRNESTADEIVARLKKLREEKRTPTDLRALDLFEALVERQSAQVQNQRGPHVEACFAALQRAFDRKWSAGEPRLMADFLYNLGSLPDGKLQAEQLREFRELQRVPTTDRRDRLRITMELCRLLYWNYDRKAEATQTLEVEIRGYEQANQGQLPYEDDEVLDSYVTMLANVGQHAAGEIVWQTHLEHPVSDAQRKYFESRLWYLYNLALEHKGEVSLGKGETLLKALILYGLKQVDAATDENGRSEAVGILMQTFDIAHRNQIPGLQELLRKFAFEQIPEILKRQQSRYGNTAVMPLSAVRDELGSNAALRYIVERMEQWPQHLQVTNENAWRWFGSSLGEMRRTASVFPDHTKEETEYKDLEPRVLQLVIAELKQYLLTGESGDQSIYSRNNGNGNFWSEKVDDFARAANQVRADHKSSGRRVMLIAEYFWNGLDRRGRAIEILLVANAAGVLDDAGQQEVGVYLQQEQRYGESIPIFEPLVQWKPDNMYWRTLLMRAYHGSHRPEQLNELVTRTDTYFHAGGRWTMQNIAQLATACLDCKLYQRSIGYFNEAIAGRQREYPGGGLGDTWLSGLYQSLASAQSALGHTKEAVDAASAAIVCWGPHHAQRTDAINRLKVVLQSATDLLPYVNHLDEEAKKTRQDSPLLRKTIGQVYQERHDYTKAISQFDLARQLQPNDKETYQALIVCYDAIHQPQNATRQLLALVDFDRHDLKLYQQLAERLKNDEAEAERAATSIIEAGPSEAENHQAMAELRQKQNRWNEAIGEWKEVAELRRLEPTGLLKLAEAEIHQGQWAPARETLERLSKTEWPSRFNDVGNQVQRFRSMLPK
jgi:hypothetical protein